MMGLPAVPDLPAPGSPHLIGDKLLQSRRPPAVARPGGTLQRIRGSPPPGRLVASAPPPRQSASSRRGRIEASNRAAGRNEHEDIRDSKGAAKKQARGL